MFKLKALAVVGLVVSLSACGSASGRTGDGAAEPVRYPVNLVQPAAYVVKPSEVVAQGKQVGVDVVTALTSYQASPDPTPEIRAALAPLGGPTEQIIEAARQLIVPDVRSVGSIVYPQLGGSTPDAASIMVVVRQESLTADNDYLSVTRTVDVHVKREVSGRWVPTSLASDGGVRVDRPDDLSEAANAVLDSNRISMSDSSRWDIYRGAVDDRVLRIVNDLSQDHEIGIVTFITGHAEFVFNTDRISDHSRGRAVDVWSIDGTAVVDQRNEKLKQMMNKLMGTDIRQLGGPFDLDGPQRRSFTDTTHQDHLHIAVSEQPNEG